MVANFVTTYIQEESIWENEKEKKKKDKRPQKEKQKQFN